MNYQLLCNPYATIERRIILGNSGFLNRSVQNMHRHALFARQNLTSIVSVVPRTEEIAGCIETEGE
jgi:hypothetical protein